MIKLGNYVVKPTIFSDKTSQVWQIPDNILKEEDTITWDFENETELSHILQLAKLSEYTRKDRPHLIMPYLPYGRQDKEISNNTTFARQIIIDVLKPFFWSMSTYDAHSYCEGVVSMPVTIPIAFAINRFKPDVICFPDLGASKRGYVVNDYPIIVLDKIRNQLNGNIEGLQILQQNNNDFIINNRNILIVDDLTDGGKTFTEAAKLLKSFGAKTVGLYTTHGIYSKGINVLFDNGIDRIFNLKGEVF